MTPPDTSFGATIRAWRVRLPPAAAGLAAGSRRRTTGLRREELCALAGISVDYLVRIEQGRSASPSAQVVGALARALQLSAAERDHLHLLAGLAPPAAAEIPDLVPAGLRRLVDRIGGSAAAAVFAADWQLVCWNSDWSGLLGDPASRPAHRRNFARDTFPLEGEDPALSHWPVTSTDRHGIESAVVADLRRATGRFPGSVRLARLVAELTAGNERFAGLWAAGAVGWHREDRKVVEHPAVGAVTVECDVMTDGEAERKLVVLSAEPGSEDESRLRRAQALGASGARAPSATAPGRQRAPGS